MTKRKVSVAHWLDVGLRKKHNPFDKVTVTTLHNYEMEIRAMISAAHGELNRLQSVQALVVEAINAKDGPDEVVVADHAIVRYLERYENFDVARIETAIGEMLENGSPEVAVRDGVVITILPAGVEARSV